MMEIPKTPIDQVPDGCEVATLGAGCFWCMEAIFARLRGVSQVVPGYSGGYLENPSYPQVTTGTTGHAEVIQFYFEPQKISFLEILEVFWDSHDPTTLNRQGNDAGPQYRSVIFYHNKVQQTVAEETRRQLQSSGIFDRPIVTEISPFMNFYAAEPFHHNYYEQNKQQPYCQAVIRPKLEKFTETYSLKLK